MTASDATTPAASATVKRRAPPIAVATVLALGALLAFRHSYNTFLGANEAIRYFFTVALVEQRRVDVTSVVRAYHSHVIDRAERDGRVYLDKAPGMSVLAIPGYLTDTRLVHPHGGHPPPLPIAHTLAWMTLVASSLPALAAALALARTLARRTGSTARGAALLLALLVATPFGLYATLFFGHAAAGSFIALAFVALEGVPDDPSRMLHRALFAGLSGSLAVACEYTTAPVVALVGAFALARGGWRAGIAFAAAMIPVGALLAAYHTAAFGGPFKTGYTFLVLPVFRQAIAHGVMGVSWPRAEAAFGITFGRERGLFFCAPWLLLGLPGMVALVRRDRAAGVFVAAACALTFWINAGFFYWNGGDCACPRHLVAVVPLLAYAAMHATEVSSRPFTARAIAVTGGGLAIVSLVQLWWAWATFPFHPEAATDPFYTVSLPLFARLALAPGPCATWLPAWVRATLTPLLVVAAWGWLAGSHAWRRSVAAVVLALVWLVAAVATADEPTPANVRALRLAAQLVDGG